MKKGELIGKGKTAEVYEWGPDRVLKLFFNKYDNDRVQYEAEIGNALQEAGILTPKVFDMIEVDERRGLVLQRIFGKSISKHINAEPWKLYWYAKQMARLHFKIHNSSADGLPSQKDRFAIKISRSSEILGNKAKKILDYLESLPDGNSVCHGDLHFSNIIVSDKGLVAVDWNNAYKGNPLGDVARAYIMLSPKSFSLQNSVATNIINVLSFYPRWMTCWTYINEYMRLAMVGFEEIDAWILPVAAAKLKDNIQDRKWLMDIIDKHLEH